jgi:hypothetical protein
MEEFWKEFRDYEEREREREKVYTRILLLL